MYTIKVDGEKWWNLWPYQSGRLRRRGRNRIKTEPMMMMIF